MVSRTSSLDGVRTLTGTHRKVPVESVVRPHRTFGLSSPGEFLASALAGALERPLLFDSYRKQCPSGAIRFERCVSPATVAGDIQ